MEESYIVHKRRKAAAAKNREKTPEPPKGLAGLLFDDDEDDARAKMEEMVEETEKMEELLMKETQKHTSQELIISTELKKKHSSSALSDNAISEPEVKLSLETSSDNGSRILPRKIKNTLEKDSSNNRTCPQTDNYDESIVPSISSALETVQIYKRLANDKKPRIKKDTQNSVQNIQSPTRTKKRHKTVMDPKRYLNYSSDEDNDYVDKKCGKLSSPSAVTPQEGKIKRKSRSKSTIITHDDADHRGSSKNDLLTQKHQGRKTRTSSRHRESSSEVSKEVGTEKYNLESKQDSELEQSVFPKKLDSNFKKQIIPLSNESLIEDLAKAQEKYWRREMNIMDSDTLDPCCFYNQINEDSFLRKRKSSIIHTELEKEQIIQTISNKSTVKGSWFSWLRFFYHKKYSTICQQTTAVEDSFEVKKDQQTNKRLAETTSPSSSVKDQQTAKNSERVTIFEFFRAIRDFSAEFREFIQQNPGQVNVIFKLRNRCFAELIVMIIYCGLGAFMFRFTESAFESFYKCGVKRVKRDFLDSLWNYSHNLREDDWKSMARRKLMEFEEQLHAAHEAGVHSYSGQKSWTFLNAVVYCLTVITTIGYGHIAPTTTTGRALTIVYAIFGIPMFLIILADFGKLFTRGIKFLWAFIRRLYYTGSCRKVRRTVPVQEVMKGVQLVYDFATFRRPSQMNPEEIEEMQKHETPTQNVLTIEGNHPLHPESISVPDTPGTPNMSTFAIDDEFNLPISVAISILLGYIFVGATLYHLWEKEWSFFESFYFVFISMSTIGFGDYVPTHPIYMMCSIVYLVFGLALTSMCINVVQVMLSDQFKHASQKIGATIGFEVAEDDGSIHPAELQPVELADVHSTIKDANSNEHNTQKSIQEEVSS